MIAINLNTLIWIHYLNTYEYITYDYIIYEYINLNTLFSGVADSGGQSSC